MRLQHILEAVYSKPWLITPAGWEAVHRVVQAKLGSFDRVEPQAARPTHSYFGDPIPQMTFEDRIAVIPIKGVIAKGLSHVEKSCGACGTEDVSADLSTALASVNIQAIVLNFDTPGGSVAGIPELASSIAAANQEKRIVAFTEGQMCSAGYFLAAGCYAIYATRTAEVGCIGTFVPFLDQSEAYAQAGLSVDIIRADGATMKGEGFPGTSLSEEFRAHLLTQINEINGWFTGHVSAYRNVGAPSMQGQAFLGEDAAKRGLVDGIVGGLDEVLAKLRTGMR